MARTDKELSFDLCELIKQSYGLSAECCMGCHNRPEYVNDDLVVAGMDVCCSVWGRYQRRFWGTRKEESLALEHRMMF